MSANHLLELAQDIVKRAQAAGASDAECTIAEGEEFSANVRMREVENLKEAGSRGAGLRILIGRHTGASYTSDLSQRGDRAPGEIGHRTGRHHHRRSARRPAGPRRIRHAERRPGHVLRRRRGPRYRPQNRDRQTRRRRGALERPADFQLRRRFVRQLRGTAHFRQFARICGRVPFELLLAEHVAGGARWREHGARLLVHHGARVFRLGSRGARRPYGGPARPAAAQRGQGGHAKGAGGVRAADGAQPAGQHLRSRPRHVDLPPGIVPRRQTGRKGGERRTSP